MVECSTASTPISNILIGLIFTLYRIYGTLYALLGTPRVPRLSQFNEFTNSWIHPARNYFAMNASGVGASVGPQNLGA